MQELVEKPIIHVAFYFGLISRAAILTGRYQTRSGVYPGVFNPNSVGGESAWREGGREGGWNEGRIRNTGHFSFSN